MQNVDKTNHATLIFINGSSMEPGADYRYVGDFTVSGMDIFTEQLMELDDTLAVE